VSPRRRDRRQQLPPHDQKSVHCIVDRVADPIGLFRRLDPGQPISKLVRE
jgi:hypothetical protein